MNTGVFRHAAVVGGAGAVGRLFLDLLRRAGVASIASVDCREAQEASHIRADILRPSPGALDYLSRCDLVILATPEDVAIHALAPLAECLAPSTLLVDTLSVKSGFSAALAASAFAGEALGVNPMFAPDLGFAGRSVIVTPHSPGGRGEALLDTMRADGAQIVSMTADAHDRACSTLQVATHAAVLGFARALLDSGYRPAELVAFMPPPHRTLLALLGRMLAADPAVYHDIQAANPHAAPMRARLLEAQRHLDAVVAQGPTAFADEMSALRRMLSESGVDHAALCARLFAVT